MRTMKALAVLALFLPAPAGAEILYARPDADTAGATYRWEQNVITDGISFTDAIGAAKAIGGSRPLEIRLLRRAGTEETLYSIDLRTSQLALRWYGSEENRLFIRGQVDRSQPVPRPLTTLVGGRLSDMLCRPEGVDLCHPSLMVAAMDAPQDPIDGLANALEHANTLTQSPFQAGRYQLAARPPDQDVRYRLPCFFLWESSFVEFTSLGLRDCWLAAVAAYASSNVSLRDSVVSGSTYAFAAVGKKGMPETAHSFEITGNFWRQSPSTYRSRMDACDIHNDWDCPVDVWSEVPWGVVHHHFWSPLNGALFAAKDILGNVRIADNYLGDAYNGVRSKVSGACLADPHCRERVNIGFEIVGNVFERIRDNPVEPEARAAYWIVKHNTFLNVYAAISTDGVSGHDLLVFGNIFALDEIPGTRCRDAGWSGSRQFQLTPAGGKWSTEQAEGDEASCTTHRTGTVFKFGLADDAAPDTPLLDRVFFFNNSLRTRSPLFRAAPAPPITSHNNAVQFIGCGAMGAEACRQQPAADPSCAGRDVWTRDGLALYAECFPTRDSANRPIPHQMAFNAYNRAPGPEFDTDRDRVNAKVDFAGQVDGGTAARTASERIFAVGPQSPLANAGCNVRYANGALNCRRSGGPVGAMLPTGERFDLDLPFRFPFDQALRQVGAPNGAP
jgi:hypothetical protein